jgi:hypothetical protein
MTQQRRACGRFEEWELPPGLAIRSCNQVTGTSAAIRAFFVLRTVEANMPFSLGSYLLGVGTVVGALAFGFGGGVLLTNTAMKESPAGPTRLERLSRAEPEPSAAPPTPTAQTTLSSNQPAATPNPVTALDQEHPASVAAIKQDAPPAQQAAAVRTDPVPASQAEPPPEPDAASKPEQDTPVPAKQAAGEPQPPKEIEQTERTKAKPVESRETDRRAERSRRYAERRQRDIVAPRMRQQRFEVQEEPAQEIVVSRPPEQHFDLFGGFFGRPADAHD